MHKYVQVVVNVSGIEDFFDYHVPEEFENELQIGSLVLVPFGKQVVQGIIHSFIEIPQVPKTKAIENVLDSKPVITPAQQKLAEWMAKETLSGLSECYQLMLPPGISRKADRIYKLGSLPENLPAFTSAAANCHPDYRSTAHNEDASWTRLSGDCIGKIDS